MKRLASDFHRCKTFLTHTFIGLLMLIVFVRGAPVSATPLQEQFDPVPTVLPEAIPYTATSGRTFHYAVLGPTDGTPVLFLNGSPSNWSSIDFIAPYKSLLEAFNLRIIQPERLGQGKTIYTEGQAPYTNCPIPTMTPESYADDWADLMQSLGYQKYSIFAASAGGLYANHFVKKYWSRVTSLHLSSALDNSATRIYCPFPGEIFTDAGTINYLLGAYQFIFDNPAAIWGQLQTRDLDTVNSVDGLFDWFNRTTSLIQYTNGQIPAPGAMGALLDGWSECNFPIGDLSMVQTPVYIYHGMIDQTVPVSMAQNNATSYPNVIRFRQYPNDAHLSSFRHMGQTLLDISQAGSAKMRLICKRPEQDQSSAKTTMIVPEKVANQFIAQGKASEDICAWVGTPGE